MSHDFKGKVLIGNIVLYPAIIREFLKKSHYYLTYEPEYERLTLNANHGFGGRRLFEIRNASYESAAKLADQLGLAGDGEYPTTWTKWNPIFHLHHDGSDRAKQLHSIMNDLGLPHTIHDSATLRLMFGNFRYEGDFEAMVEVIREQAVLHAEALASTP